MSNYNKFFAALVGNFVGLLLVWLATRGIAECAIVDQVETCTAFGMSQAQITAVVLTIFNSAFVYFAPKNKP